MPKKPNLPEIDIFEVAPLGKFGRMPREWVIDWPYIQRLKDERTIKQLTKIKIDYLAQVVDLEKQMNTLERQMLNDLNKALEG
jgi:hypothetical protein